MLQLDVNANVRTTHGKGAARVLRSQGLTPAVVYGIGVDPVSLELETKSITKTLLHINRRNAVISLEVNDGKKKSKKHVIIKELQVDPVKDSLVHADFCEIALDAMVTLAVPVEHSGNAIGVELGGILQAKMPTVSMKGKILDFPDSIFVDISELAIEDGVDCKDLKIPANMELLENEDRTVIFVADPAKVKLMELEEEVEETAEEEEGAEEGGKEGGEEAPAEAEAAAE